MATIHLNVKVDEEAMKKLPSSIPRERAKELSASEVRFSLKREGKPNKDPTVIPPETLKTIKKTMTDFDLPMPVAMLLLISVNLMRSHAFETAEQYEKSIQDIETTHGVTIDRAKIPPFEPETPDPAGSEEPSR